MRASRVLAGLIFAALLALFPFLSAVAGAQWCDTDPPVSLTQAAGSALTGHLTIGAAGSQYLRNVEAAQVGTSLNITAAGVATKFTVTVPGEGFATRVILSSGEDGGGLVYDYIEGVAGQPMTVTYMSIMLPHTWSAQYTGIGGSQCSWAGGYCQVSMCASYTQTVTVEWYTYWAGSPAYDWTQYSTGYSCGGYTQKWIGPNVRVDAINVNCPGYCSNFQIWIRW